MAIKATDLAPWAQRQILKKLAMQEAQKEELEAQEKRKKQKYHNTPTARNAEDGTEIKFDSLKEARRYDELMLMLKAGQISDLRLQHSFTLIEGYTTPDGKRVKPERYVADFTYWCGKEFVVEDIKGGNSTKTKVYEVKKKQMLDKFGITITEI